MAGSRLVLVRKCGELVVYDLPSRKIERIIPRFSAVVSAAVVGELLFAVSMDQFRPGDDGRVFDLLSGEELSTLSVPPQMLIARGNGLIGISGSSLGLEASTFASYAVDPAHLRDLGRRSKRLSQAYQRATDAKATGDDYARIRELERAGVRGFAWRLKNGKELDASLLPVLRAYALLLTRTMSRVEEGGDLLFALAAKQPTDAELQLQLAHAVSALTVGVSALTIQPM